MLDPLGGGDRAARVAGRDMSPKIQPPPSTAPGAPSLGPRRLSSPFDPPRKLEDDEAEGPRKLPRERPLSREEIDELVERVLEEELERLRDADEPAS